METNAGFAEICSALKDAKQQHKTLDFTQNTGPEKYAKNTESGESIEIKGYCSALKTARLSLKDLLIFFMLVTPP